MASFTIKHKFVSPKPDGSETDLLRPSDWNDEHNFELTGSGAVARLATGTGPAEFVPFGTGANEIPLNSHLGSAAYATLGNAIGNALEVIDVGDGVAGLPTIDGRNIVNLTLDEDGPLPEASTSQKGIVQLTNSFSSTSETLAVTPKALSDGLASVEWPGVHTGSSETNTNYPIGTTILVARAGAQRLMNVSSGLQVMTALGGSGGFSEYAQQIGEVREGSGSSVSSALSGTWRSRGSVPYRDPASTDRWMAMYQRIA